jgi:hypothetical protein
VVWITPPFASACFTTPCVQNILNHFLCAGTDHLSVVRVEENIFMTRFATRNVSRFVLARGSWQMQIRFWFHTSMEAARGAAGEIQTRAPIPQLLRLVGEILG